ncbi:MAG: COG1470 family protein, partial [Pseudonocardiales bacterium]
MGAITSLERRSISVAPGGEARCAVLVRNTGTVVDQFTVEILGDAKGWAQVDPAVVNLLPDAESTVVVLFRPPRSSDLAAGNVPFGIRVSSREDRAATVIEEGTLQIEAFTDVRIELVPRRAWGRRQAKIEVAVDNLGNHPATLAVDAVDADENLQFRPEHTDLTLQSGTTAFVGVLIRPVRTFLRGPERTLPFQIRAIGPGLTPTVAEGAMVQQARLPKWLPAAIAALLAVLIGLVALWFAFLRPTIVSTAQEAAAEEVQQVAETANAAKVQADEAVRVATGGAP